MSWAAEYVGKDYADGARGPDAYDCWGLVRAVFARFSVELPDFAYTEAKLSRTEAFYAGLEALGPKFHRVEEPTEGAVVLLRYGSGRPHVGICVDTERMLHCISPHGVVVSRLDGPDWRNGIQGYYLPRSR